MRYEEIVSYIEAIPKFTEKHSLAHTRRFLDFLGNPDREYASVHIAGTNGKGSVCAFLSFICREAGVSCGMFTSPHLTDMRERMQIDGKMIPEEAFAEAFWRVRRAAEALAEEGLSHPSYFEFLYLMACCFFAEAKPDVVLVETGLGGRLDATNTLERPLVTVITSVSLDHMQYLGTTVSEIAFEKAGILKPGVPAVAWCGDPEAARVIERRAREVSAPLFPVTGKDIQIAEGESLRRFAPQNDWAGDMKGQPQRAENGEVFLNRASGIDFFVRSGYDSRQVRLWVPGAALFQTENAALAARTAEVLWHKTELFAKYRGPLEEKPFEEKAGNAAREFLTDPAETEQRPADASGGAEEEKCSGEYAAAEAGHFDELLRAGIGRMRWPCRMEEILPDVYLDGAHNEDGIRRFAESMERVLDHEAGEGESPSGAGRPRRGGGRRFVLLFGAVNDKDYGAMIRRLAGIRPACVIATEVPGSRKAAAEQFAEAFAENGVKNVTVIKTAKEALAKALEEKKDGVVGICGSLYLAGEIRGYL